MIGDIIREKRTYKGYTVRKLSFLCDISMSYLYSIENNSRIPSKEILDALNSRLDLEIKECKRENLIGENLKIERKTMGLSVKELADKCKINHFYLYALESGTVPASQNIIDRIAYVLGVVNFDTSNYVKKNTRHGIGKKVRDLRLSMGIPVQVLSKISTVGESYIYQIENNVHSPSLKTIVKLANALNVSIENLL